MFSTFGTLDLPGSVGPRLTTTQLMRTQTIPPPTRSLSPAPLRALGLPKTSVLQPALLHGLDADHTGVKADVAVAVRSPSPRSFFRDFLQNPNFCHVDNSTSAEIEASGQLE